MATSIATTANEFTLEFKDEITRRVTKRLDDTLAKGELNGGDIAFLCGLSLATVRDRMKANVPASEIVREGFERGVPKTRFVMCTESVKAYVASLPPDERQKFIDEITK